MFASQCRWLFYPFQLHLFLYAGCFHSNAAACFIHFGPISSLMSDVCDAISLVILSISAPSSLTSDVSGAVFLVVTATLRFLLQNSCLFQNPTSMHYFPSITITYTHRLLFPLDEKEEWQKLCLVGVHKSLVRTSHRTARDIEGPICSTSPSILEVA